MSESNWTDDELCAWLDEMLPGERMSELETELRESQHLRNRVATIARNRDTGLHSVGEIWRRNRASCPSRAELGGLLLGTLEAEAADYVEFHIRTVGCRYCIANLEDLESETQQADAASTRRHRFFQSSAGYLKPGEESFGQ